VKTAAFVLDDVHILIDKGCH